jgi:Ca2+-binding RTX toxin-like protein
MSVNGKFLAHPRTLLFNADNRDDSLHISRDTAGHILANDGTIRISGGAPTVDNTALIQANGGAGNDVITLDETNGPLPAVRLSGGNGSDALTGGSGNDQLSGDNGNDSLSGGIGNDQLSGGNGDDILLGGSGIDQLTGGNGNDFVDGDGGADTAFLGAGDDVFRWDQGDGSDSVDGGAGLDELLFNGFGNAEIFTLSADADGALFTRDLGNIVMDLASIEKVTVNAFAGADTININDPSGTAVSEIDIKLGVGGAGDGAIDKIFINDDDDVQVINNGNGDVTILGVSRAIVHITGFETANDQLVINGDLFHF